MKHIITIAVIIAAIAGCTNEDSNTKRNLDAANGLFEAFNRHDWVKMVSFYADTAEFLDPSFGTEYVKHTRVETTGKYEALQQMFPDIMDSVVSLSAVNNKVVIEFVSSGTPAGGSKWHLPICTVLTFKDGLIVKDATYYDNQ